MKRRSLCYESLVAAALGSHLETQMKPGTDQSSKNRYDPPPSSSAFIRGITGIAIPPARIGDIYLKGGTMKRIVFLFVAVVTATGVIAWMAPS